MLDQSTVSASVSPRHPVDCLELWRPEDMFWNGKKTTRFKRNALECWKFSKEVTLPYLQVSYFDLPLNKRTYIKQVMSSRTFSSKRSVCCVKSNTYSHVKFVNYAKVCSKMTVALSSMTVLQLKEKLQLRSISALKISIITRCNRSLGECVLCL